MDFMAAMFIFGVGPAIGIGLLFVMDKVCRWPMGSNK